MQLTRTSILLSLTTLALSLLPTLANAQNLLVASYFGNYATDFSPNGTNLGVFASSSGTSRFDGMAFDANGYLYIAGVQSGNIRRFSPTGVDLGNFVTVGLSDPEGIAFDKNGNLYVCNANNNIVRRFSSSGADLGVFANVTNPALAAFDSAGNLYVSSYSGSGDFAPTTIYRFSSTGQALGVFASGFSGAEGLAFDAAGNVYVGDRGSNLVRRFSPTGVDMGVFASTGMNDPTGLVFDASGNLYVANYRGSTVRRFSSTGIDLGDFATGRSSPVKLIFHPAAVPEPGTVALMVAGGVSGAGWLLRRRRKQAR